MINKSNKELLFSVTKKDCRWDYYVGSGAGGQKKNKTANCVRCTHTDSGAVGKSEEGRSQAQNKKDAFHRMADTPKFKAWVHMEKSRRLGTEAKIEKEVKKSMIPQNIKVEVKDENGKWIGEGKNE